VWQIDLGDRSVLVGNSVGMLHLAVLITNPGKEIPAAELVAGVAALDNSTESTGFAGQPVLDRIAIQQYWRRLSELAVEIEQLESRGEHQRAVRARTDRDWLVAQLAASTGIGGRSRPFTDNVERARLAVGKAIRRAISRIHDADPVVGEHLRYSVHTGVRCWYRFT